MKHTIMILLLFVVSCNSQDETAINMAPPPEDKTGFTYIKEGGFAINYNRENVSAKKVDMGDSDIVMGVEVDGEARAYPVNFMTGPLNEVVNDHLGKKNIAVTWCSVDYSGVVYHREFDGRPFHFGVLGMNNGTMVLYDRQTRSRWNQLVGKAVEGRMQGQKMIALPSTLTTWKQWLEAHPETTVYVNRKVPYQPLFTAATIKELATKNKDSELGATDLVLALEGHINAKAYSFKRLVDEPIINDTFEEIPILIALSNDHSTAKIYDRRVDGQTLNFKQSWLGQKLIDSETGTEWSVLTGTGQSGKHAGKTLTPIPAPYVLWFAWKGYRPDTAIHGES